MVQLTALSSRSGRAIATFLNFYVSHDSTARYLIGAKNITLHLFRKKFIALPTVKELSKSVNSC